MVTKKIPQLDSRGLRQFALIFATVVAGLFGILIPVLLGSGWAVPWAIAVGVALWGLLAPRTIRPFYRIWMRFGLIMNAITTPIILGVVYYVVVLPYGLVIRVCGKDPMSCKWDSTADSYRSVSKVTDSSQMKRPF